MPTTLFSASATEVAALDKVPFADLCNRLLRAEGSRWGLRPEQVETSLRIDDPDGGSDARVADVEFSPIDRTSGAAKASKWLPARSSVWQFKSGNAPSAGELKKEFAKPEVQAVLDEGGSYMLLLAEDMTPRKQKSARKALKECCEQKGIATTTCRVLCAGEIGQWVEEHPALLLWPGWSNRPKDGDWMNWEAISGQARFKVPFKSDRERAEIIDAMRVMIEHPQPTTVHLRLEGFAGVGKTRLTIEMVRALGAEERTLYAGRPNDIPSGFWNWLRAQNEAQVVLLVDECSREEAYVLSQHAETCNGRARVISIGLAIEGKEQAAPDVLRLDTLGREATLEVIKEVAPKLPPTACDFVQEYSSGYVKLAVALAKALETRLASSASIGSSPEVHLRELIAHSEVNDVIQKLLVPDEKDRNVMAAVALLPQTGWEGELEGEGQATTQFLDIEWKEARRRAGRLVTQGYIAKSGRYRYVTPHLLAVQLAGQVWEDFGTEVLSLLPKLPTLTARRGLLERLRHLSNEPHAQATVNLLLSENGLFPDVDSLNDQFRAQVFEVLASADNQAGMNALNRLMHHLPRDTLLEFKEGRRHIIWTLEKLVWWPETFFPAARLLLRLADAENESWGNNASGIWPALFATHLGGTAVPAIERHLLVEEALDSSSVSAALLAVRAIATILSRHESRTHGAEYQGGRVVPQEWHPKTRADVWEAKRSGLYLLDKALNSSFEEVRLKARKLLIDIGRDVMTQGLFSEVIERWKRLPMANYEEKRDLRDQAETLLEFEGNQLNPEQKHELDELIASLGALSFNERLHRIVGPRSWQESSRELKSRDQYQVEKAQEVTSLVQEATKEPTLLREELPFLAEQNGYTLGPFVSHLAETDTDFFWWPDLEKLVRSGKGFDLAASYLSSQARAGRGEKRERILDEWLKEPSLAPATLRVAVTSWRGFTDSDAGRVIALLSSGQIAPSLIGPIFPSGDSTKLLSSDTFIALLEALQAATCSADEMAMSLLWIEDRLKNTSDEISGLSPFFWRALEFPDLPLDGLGFHALEERGFEPWLSQDPSRMAEAMLNVLERQSLHGGRGQSEHIAVATLKRASKKEPQITWEQVGHRLLNPKGKLFSLLWNLEACGIWWQDPEIILNWARQNPEERARLVAQITPLAISSELEDDHPYLQDQLPRHLNSLARGLLIEFGAVKGVSSALSGKFHSGSFMGPISGYLKNKLDVAKQWAQDPAPAIKSWSQELIRGLEAQIKDALVREEEEQLLMRRP